jgi:ATP synthase subunit c
MGVSLAEGMLMNGLFKSAARQPDIIPQLRSLMIMGIAFIEGTFFVTLVFSFIIK